MDPDLHDLLSAWLGNDLDPARRDELLARLRGDEAFRRAFAEEVRLLGLLRAVQSTEPRWLLLEDELGWSAADRADGDAFEERVARRILEFPPARKFDWRTWGAMAAAAAVVLASSLLLLWPGAGRAPQTPAWAAGKAPTVAVLVKSDGAEWEADDGPRPSEGAVVPAGRLRLRSGRYTLTFLSGVKMSVEGPADLELLSVERVFCHRGKLRTHVPPGAEGFTVLAPGAAVVDLGTEFGMNVGDDGKADLMVFEGKAEVSVLNEQGDTFRSELLQGRKAVAVDGPAGLIADAALSPDQFTVPPALVAPALKLSPDYAAAVRQSEPWGYWRFQSLANGLVPNEVAGRPGLRAAGPVQLTGAADDNRSVVFQPDQQKQVLTLDGLWTPPAAGYAVELWALSEGFNVSALVSLIAQAEGTTEKHVFLLELMARSQELLHGPCTVRFLDRWPPGQNGGVNVFSRAMYIPYRWQHVVAQKSGGRLELYIDGRLAGTAEVGARAESVPCRLVAGRLKQAAARTPRDARPFVGRLDELAVYERPLTPEEIRRHQELATR